MKLHWIWKSSSNGQYWYLNKQYDWPAYVHAMWRWANKHPSPDYNTTPPRIPKKVNELTK